MVTTTTTTTRHRFTVEEFHCMANAGLFSEDDRVELIDGEILDMTPVNPPHISCVGLLTAEFASALKGRAFVLVQSPVALSLHSEPEPDVVVLKWREDFYASAMAGPEDVLLIIEVADSSLAHDRDVKALQYARAGVPEYWLVDLRERRLLIFRQPSPEGYRAMFDLRGSEVCSPLAFPDLQLTVAGILPRV